MENPGVGGHQFYGLSTEQKMHKVSIKIIQNL